jgi:putative redox protein
VELRLITGAGHGLRHDPRAVAVLIGWLDRQATEY